MHVFPSILFLGAVALAPAQDKSQDPHAAHHAEVDKRGDKVMGFSHEKTTHHFRLYKDGGAIEVTANDAADVESRGQIRGHLPHIAQMFSAGNFRAPMLVHAQVPPGVETLKKRVGKVDYTYSEMERGGRVRITTADPEALAAVHEFLRFQIADHRTGDTTEVREETASKSK